MNYIVPAARQVFRSWKYTLFFAAFTLLFIAMYVGVPIYTVPGNTLAFWLSEITPLSLVLMLLTAMGIGLLLSMHVYLYRCAHGIQPKEAGAGTIATITGFVTGLFASATCAACIGGLLSFIGFPTVLLLLQYRVELALLSLALIVVSLHYTARRFYKACGLGKRAKKN